MYLSGCGSDEAIQGNSRQSDSTPHDKQGKSNLAHNPGIEDMHMQVSVTTIVSSSDTLAG